MTKTLKDYIAELDTLEFKNMFNNDFFLTWEHTPEELEAVFTVADTLRHLRENNISTKIFDSGLGSRTMRFDDNETVTVFFLLFVIQTADGYA